MRFDEGDEREARAPAAATRPPLHLAGIAQSNCADRCPFFPQHAAAARPLGNEAIVSSQYQPSVRVCACVCASACASPCSAGGGEEGQHPRSLLSTGGAARLYTATAQPQGCSARLATAGWLPGCCSRPAAPPCSFPLHFLRIATEQKRHTPARLAADGGAAVCTYVQVEGRELLFLDPRGSPLLATTTCNKIP
jgi:hypothetical protein